MLYLPTFLHQNIVGKFGVNMETVLYVTSQKPVCFVEVDFLWNRTVDSLKTSFHLLL